MLKRYLAIASLVVAVFTSCVNKDYDIDNIKNANTDINFGGENLALPLGSFKPVTLSEFLKPGDLLKVVDGAYQINYAGDKTNSIDPISPISISVALPDFPATDVDFSDMSIDDIDLPEVKINTGASVTFPNGGGGYPVTPRKAEINNHESPLKIGYTFTDQIKQINWITFGDNPNLDAQLLEFDVIVNVADVLDQPNITFENFSITFPYGFEIKPYASDFYGGTISADKKTYTITNKAFVADKKISLLVHKVTFDPARDQTILGELNYLDNIITNATVEIGGIATGNGGEVTVNVSTIKQLKMSEGEFNTNKIYSDAPVEQTQLDISQDLGTTMVKSLRSSTLKEPTPITITITEQGLPAKVDKITFEDYTIKFPDFLVFEDPELNRTKTLNLKDGILERGKPYTKIVNVVGFKFSANPVEPPMLNLSGVVETQGQVSVPELLNVKGSDITTVTIQPSVTFDAMNIKTVTGVVQPEIDIDPIVIAIELDDNMDFIKDCSVDLDRIAMKLDINNTAQVSSDISITLTPKDDNNQPITENIVTQSTGLSVQAQSNSQIWLSNSKIGMPEGYTFVENTKMNNLLRKVPTTIEANIQILTNNNESTVDISSQEQSVLDVKYEIVAPLALGPDFKLVYNENVNNLQQDLADILEYINTLEILLDAKNGIPLDLLVGATAHDTQGNPIDVDITVSNVIKAAKAADNTLTATESQVVVKIIEKSKGELKKLDQVKLMLNGDSSDAVAGAELKDNQTLNLNAKARIPGGLNIKPKK